MIDKLRPFALLLGLSFALDCYCWQPPHVMEPKCVIAHEAVDCTVSMLGSSFAALGPLLGGWISGGSFDWEAIEKAAWSLGFRDGGCFLTSLAGTFAGKASAKRAMVSAEAQAALTRFKQHFGAPPHVSFVVRP